MHLFELTLEHFCIVLLVLDHIVALEYCYTLTFLAGLEQSCILLWELGNIVVWEQLYIPALALVDNLAWEHFHIFVGGLV